MKHTLFIILVLFSICSHGQVITNKGSIVDTSTLAAGRLGAKVDTSSVVKISTAGVADGDYLKYDLANTRFMSFTPSWKTKTNDSVYTLGNVGIGYALPSNVLYVKNKVSNDGITIQGGNAGASVPAINFLDSNLVNSGSISIQNINANGAAVRGLFIKTPASTTGTDNWTGFRFNGASNKIMFGSTGFQELIQSGHRLTFLPDRLTNTGGDTSTAPIVIMKGTAVSIGTAGVDPVASALLELKSTTKGLLVPKMTGAQMVAISSPASGLIIYNTDSSAFCFYTGSVWSNISGAGTANNFAAMTPPDTASTIAPTSRIASVSGSDVTTTLVTASDVTGLSFWGRANKKYMVHGELKISCNNTGGVKFAISSPTGSATLFGNWIGSSTTVNTPMIGVGGNPGVLSGTAFARAVLSGVSLSFTQYLTTAGTAGPITLQFASGVATQTSSVLIGSTFQIQEVN